MKINEMMKMLKTGRWKAIVKQVGARRMFMGIERVSTRSRKRQVKYMCAPQDLDRLVAEHEREKAKPAPES